MNLQHLSNRDFEFSFQQVVKSERKIMHIVLQHIQEAERRKLYLAKGFSSLFDYLTKELKYSGSSAQRRIQGARMLTAVPSVAEKLETGALNLSQVAELQRASREAEKIHDIKVTPEAKAEILECLIGKNTSETQQAVASALKIPANDSERITTQKDNSKRFQGMFTEQQFRKFEEVRDFLAHKNFKAKRTQKMSDFFETMFDEILKQKKVEQSKGEKTQSASHKGSSMGTVTSDKLERNHALNKNSNNTAKIENDGHRHIELQNDEAQSAQLDHNDSENAEAAVRCGTATTWNSLTPKRKKFILELDQSCQYEDYETGKVCGSTFNLEVDHITPRHQGGTNDPMNLRVLCRAHNQFRNRAAVNVCESFR